MPPVTLKNLQNRDLRTKTSMVIGPKVGLILGFLSWDYLYSNLIQKKLYTGTFIFSWM